MGHINVEIKAKCDEHSKVRSILTDLKADFKGEDHQIDTYFQVPNGRLKLREGNIENHLIFYERENKEGPKQSNVILLKTEHHSPVKEILTKSNGVLVVVDKKREIYFVEHVKFHIDTVKELGTFVEIEVIDKTGTADRIDLHNKCQYYLDLFGIEEKDLLSSSYSDMLMKQH